MIVKSPRNAIANAHNPFQGKSKRVLTVCSAAMLRSPTLANYLHKEFGYNTRACGLSDYALIPLSEALVAWADIICYVDEDVKIYLSQPDKEFINEYSKEEITLNIPDNYDYGSEELIAIIREQWHYAVRGEM